MAHITINDKKDINIITKMQWLYDFNPSTVY